MNKNIRKALKTRAKQLCEYCFSPEYFSPDPFECDHIIPISKGGNDDLENFALACSGCNGLKHDSTHATDAATGQSVPLYNPRRHIWSEHFTWNKGFTLIIGISPTGRASVSKLKLNREGLINLRTALVKVGEHPN